MYVARLSIRLPTPLETTAPLVLQRRGNGILAGITATATPTDGHITELHLELEYVGNIRPVAALGATFDRGIVLRTESGHIDPKLDAAFFVAEIAHSLSAMTLQTNVFATVDNMEALVGTVTWRLPSGATHPALDKLGWIALAAPSLRNKPSRPAQRDDYSRLQRILLGAETLPVWQPILADAYRSRDVNLRDTVLRTATALEVGITPLLNGRAFDLSVLRGAIAPMPSLQAVDPALYCDVSHLWFTRHAIIHRGESLLYEDAPRRATATRPLQLSDADRFLAAIPRAIAFAEANPP